MALYASDDRNDPGTHAVDRRGKIRTLEEIAAILHGYRERGRRVVHVHGVFDLLHIGHVRYLREARALGDVLVVTVTADAFASKAPGRPIFSEAQRLEAIAALEDVDYTCLSDAATAVRAIELIRPSVYVKGADYGTGAGSRHPGFIAEREAAQKVAAEVRFASSALSSSSTLLNRHVASWPSGAREYLSRMWDCIDEKSVLCGVRTLAGRRIVVMGRSTIAERYAVMREPNAVSPSFELVYSEPRRVWDGAMGVAAAAALLCSSTVLNELASADGSEAEANGLDRVAVRSVLKGPRAIERRLEYTDASSATVFQVRAKTRPVRVNLHELDEIRGILREQLARVDAVILVDCGQAIDTMATALGREAASQVVAVTTDYEAVLTAFCRRRSLPAENDAATARHRDLPTAVASAAGCDLLLYADGSMECVRPESLASVPALVGAARSRSADLACLATFGALIGTQVDPTVRLFIAAAVRAIAASGATCTPASLATACSTWLK